MKGVTRLWLKIIIHVFIKDCTDPHRCSENNNIHHLAYRKKSLPSSKQNLICFRTNKDSYILIATPTFFTWGQCFKNIIFIISDDVDFFNIILVLKESKDQL